MAPNGNILSYAYTSAGRIPLSDVVIRVLQPNSGGKEELLSVQMTDRDGKTDLVQIVTPPAAESLRPGTEHPFASVDMTAEIAGYEQIRVENVQVFPDTQTVQYFQMIPLNAHPDTLTQEELFRIPPQNL